MDYSDDDVLLTDAIVIENVKKKADLAKTAHKIWTVFNSGALLPDSLKNNPYTKPTLIALCAIFLILPIKLYLVLVCTGFLLGLLASVRDDIMSNAPYQQFKKDYQVRMTSIIFEDKSSPEYARAELSVSRKIHSVLDSFLDRLVNSLIDHWFMPQNKSGQKEFQACVRCTLDQSLLSLRDLISKLSKDSVTLFLYGITNALLVHIQEFKLLAKSGLEDKEFLASPVTKRKHLIHMQAEAIHFRQLTAIALKRLLPKYEASSIVVNSLLKDLISSGAIWNLMDRICDPDFINMKIVQILKEKSDSTPSPGWNLVVIKGI